MGPVGSTLQKLCRKDADKTQKGKKADIRYVSYVV